ncbi:MAG: DinB family protein, partial [Acidimicrobiia bacterium]
MSLVDPFIAELEQEAAVTKRVLERVPTDRLGWKPHPKSMSLGELALHVATTPGGVAEIIRTNEREMPDFRQRPSPGSTDEVLSALAESIGKAKEILSSFDDDSVKTTWRLTAGGREILATPRIGVIRSILLNHWYHHRGQLSVYLRLLDVPVPSIYGPSADENPFA